MRGISWLAEKRFASQEGLCSMQQGSQSVHKSVHTLPSALGVCCAIQIFPDFNNCRLQFIIAGYAVAGPSGRAVWGVVLLPVACWDCGFESRRCHLCMLCCACLLEVSASSWSLVQRSPTDCGVCEWGREASISRRLGPTGGLDSGGINKVTFRYMNDIYAFFK